MNNGNVGLVLAGGGAKGAYQAGALKAIAELQIPVNAIAGASIGALNGAIVATASSLHEAAERLEKVWRIIANESPFDINLLFIKNFFPTWLLIDAMWSMLSNQDDISDDGMTSNVRLTKLLSTYCQDEAFTTGIPLYVSVMPHGSGISNALRCVIAELGIKDTADSTFINVQSLSSEDRKKALLASAAIPLLFAPQKIGGKLYSDGGQGGWMTQQGNTPITPLLENGYTKVIVVHLESGSLWSRYDFPEANIIEIRPSNPLSSKNLKPDIIDFSIDYVENWINRGYEDAKRSLQRLTNLYDIINSRRESELDLLSSLQKGVATRQRMERAMAEIYRTNSNKQLEE